MIINSLEAIDQKFFGDYDDILIFEGDFKLTSSGRSYPMNGKVLFTFFPKPRIQFFGRISGGTPLFNDFRNDADTEVVLVIPGFEPSKVSISAIRNFDLIKGIVTDVIQTQHDVDMDECYFYVNNFIDYRGKVIKANDFMYKGGLLMEYDDWEIQLQKRHDFKKKRIFEKLKEGNGHEITHVLKISKKDGSRFKKQEISKLEDVLTWIFSLCSGRHIGCPISTGNLNGKEIYKEFSTPLMSSYREIINWFPHYESNVISNLFYTFMDNFKESFDTEIIKELIHWYIEALNATFIENQTVNSQIFLEKVSYVLLTQQPTPIMSNTQFKNNRFQDNLETILIHASIDTALDGKYSVFNEHFTSGPEVLVKYRNHIAHPKRNKNIEGYSTDKVYLINQLGLYYVEVLLLYLINYDGKFMNRLRFPLWKGEHESLPWKKEE